MSSFPCESLGTVAGENIISFPFESLEAAGEYIIIEFPTESLLTTEFRAFLSSNLSSSPASSVSTDGKAILPCWCCVASSKRCLGFL